MKNLGPAAPARRPVAPARRPVAPARDASWVNFVFGVHGDLLDGSMLSGLLRLGQSLSFHLGKFGLSLHRGLLDRGMLRGMGGDLGGGRLLFGYLIGYLLRRHIHLGRLLHRLHCLGKGLSLRQSAECAN